MRLNKNFRKKFLAGMLNIAILLSIFSGMIIMLLIFIAPNVCAWPDKTIFVDDDNTDPPWLGTESDPYQYIGDAVDDAELSTGDVLIRVYAGTYNENVEINTGSFSTLTLQGNHSSNTTIDAQGSGTVITVSASWCN